MAATELSVTGVGFTSIIDGATDPIYSPGLRLGTTYYTCSVTNTNSSLSVCDEQTDDRHRNDAESCPSLLTPCPQRLGTGRRLAEPQRYAPQVEFDNGSSEIVSQGTTGSPSVFNEARTRGP